MKKYKSLDEHKKQLDTIKENIENSFKYFEHNYKRFNTFKNIVFVSTISAAEESLLNEMNKPKVEFNVLEAYISRLRGQFSKQIPSVKISAKDGKKADKEVIKTVEDHIRYMTYEANKNGTSYDCYTDTLAGGFSAGKVYTEYNGEISFHQDIFLDRCFDPTMTGF